MAKAALANAGQRGGEPPRVVVHTNPDQLADAAAHAHDEGAEPAADKDDSAAEDAGRRVPRRPVGLASCEQTGPLSPFALGVLSCDAVLERCVVGAFGQILDYGRARRLATPAQRRALAARDGGCVIPGCTALPAWCDAHHIVPWQLGGPTDLPNLVLVCPRHHTEVHLGRWTPPQPTRTAVGHPPEMGRPATTTGAQPTPRHHQRSAPTRPTTPLRRHRLAGHRDELGVHVRCEALFTA